MVSDLAAYIDALLDEGDTSVKTPGVRAGAALATLILAGEVIFFLPFVLPRVFKPTLLAVLGIGNLELGAYFSAYGVVAIGAYLLGGPLADRFAPGTLMAAALASTGLGGVYLYTLPSTQGMLWLYAGWGLTTILLFWAAMLRATRVVGGVGRQGMAFGGLEGGRGLVSALIASALVVVLGRWLPGGGADASAAEQRAALQAVVTAFTLGVFATAVLTYFVLRGLPNAVSATAGRDLTWGRVRLVLRKRGLWLNALVILCAYSGYRVLDDISLLSSEALGYDEVGAARLGALGLYLRPVAAVGAGWLADRYAASRMSTWSFVLMGAGGLAVVAGLLSGALLWVVVLGVVLASLGVYALRGLYFALIAEVGTPLALTGTAVGLVSVVGYLPDIYMAPLMGYLLDGWPGVTGHVGVFGVSVGFAVVGGVGAWAIARYPQAASRT